MWLVHVVVAMAAMMTMMIMAMLMETAPVNVDVFAPVWRRVGRVAEAGRWVAEAESVGGEVELVVMGLGLGGGDSHYFLSYFLLLFFFRLYLCFLSGTGSDWDRGLRCGGSRLVSFFLFCGVLGRDFFLIGVADLGSWLVG